MSKIKKVQVTDGVYWVEARNVNILCAAPADVVKHCMRRGLILPTEVDGVACETGPNAILLSDLSVQSGSFSNMAEFPILQMLYRQGMILPGHPNNLGQRPILAGSRDQVHAQLQYIYRGNYGLISEKEFLACGVSPKNAAEIINIKLAFSFGQVKSPGEFIETRIIDAEPVEICGGVFVERVDLNVFEFTCDGESVTVDLNLPIDGKYLSAYTLGSHHIKREYFAVIHSGQGDGWDIKGPSASSIVMFQGKIYLIDAGPNIQYILDSLGIGVTEIEGLFHTHSHDDHCAGLTALIRADHRIKYYATATTIMSVSKKMSALLSMREDLFANYFDVNKLQSGQWNNIDGLEVKPTFSPHPVETDVFRFRAMSVEGYKTYAHLIDIVAISTMESMLVTDAGAYGFSREMIDRTRQEYLTPADLKKIDVGGGQIHGDAEDFRGDRSGKIVLSHTSYAFTSLQKEIGSGASFGAVDVLIPAYKEYIWQYAYKYLVTYFPFAAPDHIQVLLNNQIVVFNPETIILKEGVPPSSVYLILTGAVEGIHSKSRLSRLLYSGSLIGDIAAHSNYGHDQTYRSMGFVDALKIPVSLLEETIVKNKLYHEYERLLGKREDLQRMRLFNEGVSHPVLNSLAKALATEKHPVGALAKSDARALRIIKSGKVDLFMSDDTFETLGEGDFLGEDLAIFGTPPLFGACVTEAAEFYVLPSEKVHSIPIVIWKLLETFEKRKKLIFRNIGAGSAFQWREEFLIDGAQIDEHHKMLFALGSYLARTAGEGAKADDLKMVFDILIDYTKYHFAAEEGLQRKAGFPGLAAHVQKHRDMIGQIMDKKGPLSRGGGESEKNIVDFLTKWLLEHVLTDDMKLGLFLRDV
jgi:hemerythrin